MAGCGTMVMGEKWGKCELLRWLSMNSLKRRLIVSLGFSTKPSVEFWELETLVIDWILCPKQIACESPLVYLFIQQILAAYMLGDMGQREIRHDPYLQWLMGEMNEDPVPTLLCGDMCFGCPSLTQPGTPSRQFTAPCFLSQCSLLLEVIYVCVFHFLPLEYQPHEDRDLDLFITLSPVSGIEPRT